MQPEPNALTDQEDITDRVTKTFTDRWNAALAIIAPTMSPVKDAFRVHGNQVLYNSSNHYHPFERSPHLPIHHEFVGPLVRDEELAKPFQQWLAQEPEKPLVYVALGTFLSHRADVLSNIAIALQQANVRVAMAIGASPMTAFESLPVGWLIAPSLPQVALLGECDLVIHHGGNNSVQEALALGVRQIILPFSTDQFANAADLERTGQATVISPNHICTTSFAQVVKVTLTLPEPKPIMAQSCATLARILRTPIEA